MNKAISLYLHVPFCLSKCAYCDFYSLAKEELKSRWVSALCRALRDAAKMETRTVDTVFFGGGTPSLLTARELAEIFESLGDFSLSDDCEISMEVNPATVTEESLRAYRALGVNRISIGMQSAHDAELQLLGRRHNFADTVASVGAVSRAGFDNFSLDLMYGLPHQTEEAWQESLDAALALSPTHLSLYALTLSTNVPLYRLVDSLPEDEVQRKFYAMACQTLLSDGFLQYEISNFAKKGRHCRHNLRYWTRGDYLGFGPSAASFYRGRRHTEAESLDAFLFAPTGLRERIMKEEALTQTDAVTEQIFLSLRLTSGLSLSEILAKIPQKKEFSKEVETLTDGGFCRVEHGRLLLTEDGFFVSNEIIARLLSAAGL